MLKSLGLISTVVSCALSVNVLANSINIMDKNYENFASKQVLMDAINVQMAGNENISIDPAKAEQVIITARKMFQYYNPLSTKESREYGGVIYERNGVMQSTPAIKGRKCKTSCGVNFDEQYNQLLKEAKTEKIVIYADWHTHGPIGDPFSKPDKEGMLATQSFLHKRGHPFIGCFYGKPSGDHLLVTHDATEHSPRRAFLEFLIGEDKEYEVGKRATVASIEDFSEPSM